MKTQSFEIKNTTDFKSVLDVDDKSRRVKAAFSRMGNLDGDGDIMDSGAYNKTIKERGPNGVNLIWHLTDHTPSLKNAVAKFKELRPEGEYLVGVTDIPNTAWGNDVLEFYKTGHINQHSVGFKTIKDEWVNQDKPNRYRLIKEVMLYEGSAVLWGANADTPTISVGKSLSFEEISDQYFETLKEVTNLAKVFKSGHFTDETFELLEIKLAQTTNRLKQLFDLRTQPADNAVEPNDGEMLLSVFKTFNNSLILQNESRRIETTTG